MCKYAIRCKYNDFFKEHSPFMNLRNIIAYFSILFLSGMTALAGPAVKTPIYLTQPDGTAFQASIRGDEFVRIKTTASGQAIIQDSDGWWCYAIYSEDGTKVSSGWKVGKETPGDILSTSSLIPYARLSEKAMEFRSTSVEFMDEPILRKMKKEGKAMTKAGSDPIRKHAIVILAEFKDIKFKYTKEDFVDLLTKDGYSVNGATGSAKEYFNDQFQGAMEFEFHVSDIVTLNRERKYYGENDTHGDDGNPRQMIADACSIADADIDFSLFDDDADGSVDNVFVFFAGHDEAEGGAEECIWSHAWYLILSPNNPNSSNNIRLNLDGTVINRYACASELTLAYDSSEKAHEFFTGIGTFCHEYSHTMGLPDFYDVDYEESGGISAGLWSSTSLMDGGNYNNLGNTPPNYNAIERLIAGIGEPIEIEKSGTYHIDPINYSSMSYMVAKDDSKDFYIFESREGKGWDAYIGGSGMLAYHLDLNGSSLENWSYYNDVNINPNRQRADLLEADGRQDKFSTINEYSSYARNIAGIFFPHGSTELTGKDLGFSITSVRQDKQGLAFTYLGTDNPLTPPSATNIVKDVYADAAIISFESTYEFEGPASVSWGRAGQEMSTITVDSYSPGKYFFILEDLEPSGKTYEIEIRFISGGIEGEAQRFSIMTRKMPAVDWPYIYLGGMKRNSDGSFSPGSKFPLRVYGASGAEEITWEFNGRQITHDGDGYYRTDKSGTLKATIYWEDGSIDKVMKQITISEEE